MKKFFVILVLLSLFMGNVSGCTSMSNGQNWRQNVPKLKNDIFMFSKLATRIALTEAKMPNEDAAMLKAYLIALRDLLSVPGEPNFDGARSLVGIKLPNKYRVYGFTIIDVLERYINASDLRLTENQGIDISLIASGIDGALSAVKEFAE